MVHVTAYTDDGADSEEEEERELTRALHPKAPLSDRRCYVYKPVSLAVRGSACVAHRYGGARSL